MKNILITGGAGFIGSNFIRMLVNKKPELQLYNYDNLAYSGNLSNLKDIENNPNYKFIKGDILDIENVKKILKENRIDTIVNFAAESHVDRSILDSTGFLNTNIMGVRQLLEAVLHIDENIRFLQISTDEVYGDLTENEKPFTEESPLKPSSPYAASKASADLLLMAYQRTFNIKMNITRCSNNYGCYQFPEKFIPLVIYKALKNEKIPVYGNGRNIRDWIHVSDHCEALLCVLEKAGLGEIYNIGAENEMENIELVKMILDILGKKHDLIEFVKDRKGHDRRYAINSNPIKKKLGWKPSIDFKNGLLKTVSWYEKNEKWIVECIDGTYMDYYNKNYN